MHEEQEHYYLVEDHKGRPIPGKFMPGDLAVRQREDGSTEVQRYDGHAWQEVILLGQHHGWAYYRPRN